MVAVVVAAMALADPTRAAPPATLVLEHEQLAAVARGDGASLSYTAHRVILRKRVRYAWVWWPVRVEAVLTREDGVVRLVTDRVLVRGRDYPAGVTKADSKIAGLVRVESAAARVEIRRAGRVVYAQDLD